MASTPAFTPFGRTSLRMMPDGDGSRLPGTWRASWRICIARLWELVTAQPAHRPMLRAHVTAWRAASVPV